MVPSFRAIAPIVPTFRATMPNAAELRAAAPSVPTSLSTSPHEACGPMIFGNAVASSPAEAITPANDVDTSFIRTPTVVVAPLIVVEASHRIAPLLAMLPATESRTILKVVSAPLEVMVPTKLFIAVRTSTPLEAMLPVR